MQQREQRQLDYRFPSCAGQASGTGRVVSVTYRELDVTQFDVRTHIYTKHLSMLLIKSVPKIWTTYFGVAPSFGLLDVSYGLVVMTL